MFESKLGVPSCGQWVLSLWPFSLPSKLITVSGVRHISFDISSFDCRPNWAYCTACVYCVASKHQYLFFARQLILFQCRDKFSAPCVCLLDWLSAVTVTELPGDALQFYEWHCLFISLTAQTLCCCCWQLLRDAIHANKGIQYYSVGCLCADQLGKMRKYRTRSEGDASEIRIDIWLNRLPDNRNCWENKTRERERAEVNLLSRTHPMGGNIDRSAARCWYLKMAKIIIIYIILMKIIMI